MSFSTTGTSGLVTHQVGVSSQAGGWLATHLSRLSCVEDWYDFHLAAVTALA